MIFETKKVPLETLGEYLASVRENLGLSVAEVVESSGICEKYLLYLEAGQYQHLPPDVYIFGFLKKLAELYSVPDQTLLEQYKKERGIINQVANNLLAPQTGFRGWLAKLVITPKLITLAGGLGLVFIAVFYLVFQVSAINRTPSLKVFEPASGSIVKGSVVNVSGQADAGSVVSINGQNVFVDDQGKFNTSLSVAVGQKELAITAQNKFGKQSSQKLVVMVEDPALAAASAAPLPAPVSLGLNLELKFSRATTISINRDGEELAKETVPIDGVKNITAQSKIILTTSDAGSTKATLNGKELGILGRNKEKLTIPFTADSNLVVKTDTANSQN
jgi:cytoskeletal protein RodZ